MTNPKSRPEDFHVYIGDASTTLLRHVTSDPSCFPEGKILNTPATTYCFIIPFLLQNVMTAWEDHPASAVTMDAPHRKFQRRSSCSALPSTTIMELNDAGAESRERLPLGSFLRLNNSFSESVTSLTDNSECAMSGDGDILGQSDEKKAFDLQEFSRVAGIEFVPDSSFQDGEISPPKRPKKKEHSKESDGEKPSRRRMQRRSSWSASTAMNEPLADDNGAQAVVKERRHRSSRKPALVLAPLPDSELDGVITSYKSSNTSEVMFEEQSSTSDRCVVSRKKTKEGVNDDHYATSALPDPEEPPRRRGRANRRASWSGGQCYEPTSDPIYNNLPSPCSDVKEDIVKDVVHTTAVSPCPPSSVHDLGSKDVIRTLLMVKHVQSGAAKARRRASWTASTVNCLDEPPVPVERPQQLVADVFSNLKKTIADYDENHESAVEFQQGIYDVPDVIVDLNQDDPTTGGTSSRRMARRSSWHASSESMPQSSVNSNASQRSSQTFVLDLSSPQMLWKRNEETTQDADDGLDEVLPIQHQGGGRKTTTAVATTSRSWMLGKSRNNQPDRSGSPDFLVVSSANMPIHDWAAQSYDEGSSCLQLTAFGDVTTIRCETQCFE